MPSRPADAADGIDAPHPRETPMTTLRTTKAMPPDALFTRPREDKRAAHAVLQDKLDAFERAGGQIEKLGTTVPRKTG
ncbi:hypothetical protein DSC_05540 [Pseudoxanthomonas spadix BD-a59]|jgi:hypothetical protein|uniref:Uncharacterized protein n=2 Tax=Pseudoxanthomonas spadix TaxID=415229 RepID=G7UQM7_PSEUP|nr:hypothetical protein DSC_05540 [Pseudoxanthomonas spadix BD-a59]RMW94921.1 hypothetical protein D9R12_11185 [Pseudoxanthomonas spadix]